jgi:hypothetical protein
MNMPRFTAEASLYQSKAMYKLDSSCGKETAKAVTPSMKDRALLLCIRKCNKISDQYYQDLCYESCDPPM